MNVTINGCALNVEVMGPEDGPVLIAHHGGGGIAELVVFEKSGHSPQIEERELFLSTVRDFLGGAAS